MFSKNLIRPPLFFTMERHDEFLVCKCCSFTTWFIVSLLALQNAHLMERAGFQFGGTLQCLRLCFCLMSCAQVLLSISFPLFSSHALFAFLSLPFTRVFVFVGKFLVSKSKEKCAFSFCVVCMMFVLILCMYYVHFFYAFMFDSTYCGFSFHHLPPALFSPLLGFGKGAEGI